MIGCMHGWRQGRVSPYLSCAGRGVVIIPAARPQSCNRALLVVTYGSIVAKVSLKLLFSRHSISACDLHPLKQWQPDTTAARQCSRIGKPLEREDCFRIQSLILGLLSLRQLYDCIGRVHLHDCSVGTGKQHSKRLLGGVLQVETTNRQLCHTT